MKPIAVSGTGAAGAGAIVNTSGNPIYDGSNDGLTPRLTLLGDTMLGGNTRLDLGGTAGAVLDTGGSNYNITINTSDYMEWQRVAIDANFGNIDLTGRLGLKGMGVTGLGNPTNTITVESGAELQFWDDSLGNSGYVKNIHVLTGGTVSFRPGNPNIYYNTPLLLEDGSSLNMFNGSGSTGTVLMQTVMLDGLIHLQVGDRTCTISNVISGPGGFFWDNFNNTMQFAAANTYLGDTDIRAGRTLALVGGGSIAQSSNIVLAATATLDVSARTNGTLTLASGQVLQGSGSLNGVLATAPGSILLPGGGNTVGMLTVSSNATLAGMVVMDIDKQAGTNDILSAGAARAV